MKKELGCIWYPLFFYLSYYNKEYLLSVTEIKNEICNFRYGCDVGAFPWGDLLCVDVRK